MGAPKYTGHEFSQSDVAVAFAKSKFSHMTPIFTDDKYYALSADDWKKALPATKTDAIPYRPEVFDCDDFGALLRGLVPATTGVNGIGWVLDPSSQHSYNLVLVWVADGKPVELHGVEPQADKFVTEGAGHYQGKNGWVIL